MFPRIIAQFHLCRGFLPIFLTDGLVIFQNCPTLIYSLAIKHGLKEKTRFFPLNLNFVWEFPSLLFLIVGEFNPTQHPHHTMFHPWEISHDFLIEMSIPETQAAFSSPPFNAAHG